jgi:histone H3/H4
MTYAQSGRRKTVTKDDVIHALRRHGRAMYA